MRGVTIYIYHTFAPVEKQLLRCFRCNRVMFSYNADSVVVANLVGGQDVFEPGQKWIEIRCHSCKTPHKILFQ